MRITGLALVPPPTAADLPKVTPELLASVLARYSRSNQGIATILSKVDLANPDASIDRILSFVDYGHASIGGLTGGLAVALDDVSMWLAYKLFEIATMADGQESSTRYITMDAANLPTAAELGIPEDLAPRWTAVMAKAFAAYHAEYTRLDGLATADPGLVRLPPDAKPAVVTRLRKNYALDRARYFIPLATRTNVGLVQSSRMWAVTVKHLDSLPHPEARAAAKLIRDELLKISPRLMRHSFAEKSFTAQAGQELATSLSLGLARLSATPLADEVWVHVDRATPPWLTESQPVGEALRHRANRYGHQGTATRRMRVTFAWNNLHGARFARLRLFASPRRADALRAQHPRGQVHLRGGTAYRHGRAFPLRRTPQRGPPGVLQTGSRSPHSRRRRHCRAGVTGGGKVALEVARWK
ncbi:MAG: FAD-dependent thymidylate synthase [Verrucomicrobia bacterium]|nr:FAD-dependent thymidylate synthase [Verrucomicrobiota bacterium]